MTIIVRGRAFALERLRRRRHGPAMRRSFVYPHRSVRAIPASAAKFALAVLTVVALTAGVCVFLHTLLLVHNQLCLAILRWSGIPVSGVLTVPLFAPIGAAPVPLVAVDEISSHGLRLWTLFSAAMVVLLELHRRIPFARTFLACLMTLLVMAVGVVVFHPASQFGSAEFATMWLRSELLVWLVLPWFSVSMFVLMQPSALFGVGWAILTQAYGFAWSAIRLAFCIAVMHYSGILFAPVFWFTLGFLADVIYLVVFYSVALQWGARSLWGKRA